MDDLPNQPKGITTNRPHTFVMRPAPGLPEELEPGGLLEIQLLLMGEQLDRQGWWTAALLRLAEVGLRRKGKPMELLEIAQLTEAGEVMLYRSGSDSFVPLKVEELYLPLLELGRKEPRFKMELKALSPVRLRHQGKEPAQPSPILLWRAAIRRVRGIAASLGVELPNPKVVHPYSKEPLGWEMVDQYRWSTTQKRKIPAGGYMGEVVLDNLPAEHLPWWTLASSLGIGKLATFGMGAFTVRLTRED